MDLNSSLNLLVEDPGHESFVRVAEELRGLGDFDRALAVCVRGLNKIPENLHARLTLAHIYYQMGCTHFAFRELLELQSAHPESVSIAKLLQKFMPEGGAEAQIQGLNQKSASAAGHTQEIVAESEFDFDEIELLKDEQK